MRIVLTGDWHFGAKGERIQLRDLRMWANWVTERESALRELARGLQPGDVVLVAGDNFDGQKDIDPAAMRSMHGGLTAISNAVGDAGHVIIIPGNHDYNCGEEGEWVWDTVVELPPNVQLIRSQDPQVVQVGEGDGQMSVIAVPCIDQGDGEGLLDFLTQEWMDANDVGARRLVLAHISRARLTDAVKALGIPLLLGDKHSPDHDEAGGVAYEGCLVPTERDERGGCAGVFQWDEAGNLSRVGHIVMSTLGWSRVTIELPHDAPGDYSAVCTQSIPQWCEPGQSILELVVTGMKQDAAAHDQAMNALQVAWGCVLATDGTVPAPTEDEIGSIKEQVPESFVVDAAQTLWDEYKDGTDEAQLKAAQALQHLVRAVGRNQEQ